MELLEFWKREIGHESAESGALYAAENRPSRSRGQACEPLERSMVERRTAESLAEGVSRGPGHAD